MKTDTNTPSIDPSDINTPGLTPSDTNTSGSTSSYINTPGPAPSNTNTSSPAPPPDPFDPLDMNNYRVEKLKGQEKSGIERWMARLGIPLAALAFILIYWYADIPFLRDLAPGSLGKAALARWEALGAERFARVNHAMLAIFVASIILWITEALPNYLTSLLVILGIVLAGVTTEQTAFAQLGHPVMWLNILSFVLASMLVKTRVAKRFALWLMTRFGRSAGTVILSFVVINIVLSAFISATTAKATILLPVFMVIAAIYGATGGKNRNNMGRNLVLQNLFQINIGASGFITGSGANLLAGSLMAGAAGWTLFSFQDWFVAAFPLALLLILLGWFVGVKLVFPLRPGERRPALEGGIERMRQELRAMGKMSAAEYKAIAIFVIVLALWATDKQHGISQTTVAFAGAVVALLPRVGIVNWNDVDIPWHLMLFSAGAYTLGAGLDATSLPATLVDAGFGSLGIDAGTPYVAIYALLTFLMLFSALLFQSKTMRVLIFIPIALGVEQRFHFPPLSLAFPLALLTEHVYVLPFNSKPALLLYNTGQYSWSDTFKFGLTMMTLSWLAILLWGETVLRWLGYTRSLL